MLELWTPQRYDNTPEAERLSIWRHALAHGDMDTVEAFVGLGFDVNALFEKDWEKQTALYFACRWGETRLFDRLLGCPKIDLESGYLHDHPAGLALHSRPLGGAIAAGNAGLAAGLIEKGCDVHKPLMQGRNLYTPLALIAYSRMRERNAWKDVFALMLEKGADPDAVADEHAPSACILISKLHHTEDGMAWQALLDAHYAQKQSGQLHETTPSTNNNRARRVL